MGKFERWLEQQPEWIQVMVNLLFGVAFIGALWIAAVLGAAFVEG